MVAHRAKKAHKHHVLASRTATNNNTLPCQTTGEKAPEKRKLSGDGGNIVNENTPVGGLNVEKDTLEVSGWPNDRENPFDANLEPTFVPNEINFSDEPNASSTLEKKSSSANVSEELNIEGTAGWANGGGMAVSDSPLPTRWNGSFHSISPRSSPTGSTDLESIVETEEGANCDVDVAEDSNVQRSNSLKKDVHMSTSEPTDLEYLLENHVDMLTLTLDIAFDFIERVAVVWVWLFFVGIYMTIFVVQVAIQIACVWNPLLEREC